MYGYIYKTTDLITKKIYVGQHKSEVFDETYLGSGRIIQRLIKKYGKERFNCELVEWCDSEEALNKREIYWILELNSRDASIGYNIATGGAFGDSGYHLGMLGKSQSKHQKECVSKALKGKKKSKSACEKMRQSKKGNSNASGGKGLKFISFGYDIQKRVPEEEIEYWISIGWKKGKSQKYRDDFSKNYKIKYKNGQYINDGITTKFVDNSQLNKYLSDGWKIGKVPKNI